MALIDLFSAQDSKALPNHPALRDNGTPIEIVDLGGTPRRRRGPMSQSEASRHLNAYGGRNDAIDHVMNCIRLYCDAAATAPWHLEKKGKALRRPDEPAEEGEIGPIALYNLLDQPNPYMDYEELISLMLIDLLLVGNAYWFKWRSNEAGQPLALYRLAPPYVKVVPGDMGIIGYEYTVPDSGQRNPLQIAPKDMMHFKLPNPHSPYYGMGIVQGATRPLDLELALTDHQVNYFESATTPSMVVQSERRIPKDVFRKLQSQLRGRYAGSKNAGELMVLEAGLKAQSIAPDAAKAQFAEMSKMSRERVFELFRVHPKLLGISTSDGTDKATDAQRVFDHNTLQPLFTILAKRISRALAQAYNVDFKIDHRYRMPAEDQVKLAGDFASIPGVTVKEVREFLDLPPTGDKEIDDLVLNLPGDDGEADDTRNGFPDRNLPGEPGRPPKGENTAAFGTVGGGSRPDLVKGSRARRPSEGKSLDDIIREIAALPVTETKALPVLETPPELGEIQMPDDPFGPRRDEELDAIVADLRRDLQDAGHMLERELLDHVEGKAFNGRTIRSRLRRSDAWTRFRERVEAALHNAAVRGLSRATLMWGSAGRTPEDDVDYDALANELIHRKGGLRSIIATQRDRVAKKVAAALEEGGGAEETDAAVREAMQVWADNQADLIAETEAVHAFNEGTLTVAETTGATHVYVQDGDDHDEPCIEANGSIWEIDHARENRLEHPRCRRAFLPLSVG